MQWHPNGCPCAAVAVYPPECLAVVRWARVTLDGPRQRLGWVAAYPNRVRTRLAVHQHPSAPPLSGG